MSCIKSTVTKPINDNTITKRKKATRISNVPTRQSLRLKERAKSILLSPAHNTLRTPQPKQKYIKRKSTAAGFRRAFDKYSPSKETLLSPIKATESNLKHVIKELDEQCVDLYLWVINMSEQYFYDNAFLLLSHCKHDEKKMAAMLHRNFLGVDINFFNNLENVTELGKGSFGTVYSCVDPSTKTRFAVKHLSMVFEEFIDHAANLLDYMDERNSIIRAMDSSFVVKFYYSLQIKVNGSLFLFFELCIGDLSGYIKMISVSDKVQISELLDSNTSDILQDLYDDRLDLLEVSFIYIFEMFCGMDFLVKCNIIHQDIKPENIMISDNLHLKIGDFGLTYKTRTIHRETNKELIHYDEINISESRNFALNTPGTLDFQDLELQVMLLEEELPEIFTKVLNDVTTFDVDFFKYTEDVLEPTFLTDTWAVGVCAVLLLFRGFNIFEPQFAHRDILRDVPRDEETIFMVHLVTRKKYYKHYIQNGFIAAGGRSHQDLMRFIASIFTPRLVRCKTYTANKDIYHFTKLINMRYVDLDIVERLETFSVRNFNRNNIYLRSVPDKVRKNFEKKNKQKYKKFENLLQKMEADRLKTNLSSTVLDIGTGVTINFFN